MTRITLVHARAYWDALWSMAVPESTFYSEAATLKWRIIKHDLSLIEVFSEINSAPVGPFETLLKQKADAALRNR